MPLGSHLRLLRAVLFTAVCLALSAVGHWWMSRQDIAFWALAVGFAVVFALALALSGRERSYLGIAGAVLVSELGLHLLFSVAQQRAGGVPTASAASSMSMPGMDMPGMVMPGAGAAMRMSSGGGTDTVPHGMWGMVAVHVLAGLLSAWWLRWGEAAAFALLRTLVMSEFGLLWLAVLLLGFGMGLARWMPPAPARRLYSTRLLPQAARCALLDVVVRRGPPTVLRFG